jgi:hypothetical protein
MEALIEWQRIWTNRLAGSQDTRQTFPSNSSTRTTVVAPSGPCLISVWEGFVVWWMNRTSLAALERCFSADRCQREVGGQGRLVCAARRRLRAWFSLYRGGRGFPRSDVRANLPHRTISTGCARAGRAGAKCRGGSDGVDRKVRR